jgi:hypothetical protein
MPSFAQVQRDPGVDFQDDVHGTTFIDDRSLRISSNDESPWRQDLSPLLRELLRSFQREKADAFRPALTRGRSQRKPRAQGRKSPRCVGMWRSAQRQIG